MGAAKCYRFSNHGQWINKMGKIHVETAASCPGKRSELAAKIKTEPRQSRRLSVREITYPIRNIACSIRASVVSGPNTSSVSNKGGAFFRPQTATRMGWNICPALMPNS